MPELEHSLVLLENRSFDHIFGLAKLPQGGKLENLLAWDTWPLHLLKPDESESDCTLTEDWALGLFPLLTGGLGSVEEVPTTPGAACAARDRLAETVGCNRRQHGLE